MKDKNINPSQISYLLTGEELANLSQVDLMILAIIRRFWTAKNPKPCFLTNSGFAQELGQMGKSVSESTIQRSIKKMANDGRFYLKSFFYNNKKRRYITPDNMVKNDNLLKNKIVKNDNLVSDKIVKSVQNKIVKNDNEPIKKNTYKEYKPIKNKCSKQVLNVSENAKKLSLALAEIVEKNFKYSKINLDQWALDFDKINRIDGIDWIEIQDLLNFALSDDFWSAQIRSASKFRKQIPNLEAKMLLKKERELSRAEANQYEKERRLRHATR